MWKDLSEVAEPMWVLMPHVISLQKIFLVKGSFNDYVNTMTHCISVKQFHQPPPSTCSMDSGVESATARM